MTGFVLGDLAYQLVTLMARTATLVPLRTGVRVKTRGEEADEHAIV